MPNTVPITGFIYLSRSPQGNNPDPYWIEAIYYPDKFIVEIDSQQVGVTLIDNPTPTQVKVNLTTGLVNFHSSHISKEYVFTYLYARY